MHKFTLGFFNFLRSFLHFMKIVCVFLILLLLFYWVQNLMHTEWGWLAFITPFFTWLVKFANNIYSLSFNFFGAVFELKYFSALLMLVALSFCMNLLIYLTNFIEDAYKSAHFVYKKTEEFIMNKSLQDSVEKEEKKIKKYSILILTKLKKKYAHEELNINIDEQNKLMNDFISAKLCVKPMHLDGGFLYQFNDFDKVDTVLDIMFKVLKSSAPLDYAICIQVDNDLEQLKKLARLNLYGQITMAANTAYRYKYNTVHKYATSQVGLFQNECKTLEVHEFKEIL